MFELIIALLILATMSIILGSVGVAAGVVSVMEAVLMASIMMLFIGGTVTSVRRRVTL